MNRVEAYLFARRIPRPAEEVKRLLAEEPRQILWADRLRYFRQWCKAEQADLPEPYFVEPYYHLMMAYDSGGYHYHHYQRARVFWCDQGPREYWWSLEKISYYQGHLKPSAKGRDGTCRRCGEPLDFPSLEGPLCYACERDEAHGVDEDDDPYSYMDEDRPFIGGGDDE